MSVCTHKKRSARLRLRCGTVMKSPLPIKKQVWAVGLPVALYSRSDICAGIYSRRHAPYPSCPVWLFLTPYAYVPCMTYFTQKRENVKIKSRRSAFPVEEESVVSEKRKITCFRNVLHDRLLRAAWMSEPSFRQCGRAFLALQESLFRIAECAV